jgi:hypothetical protein
MDEQRCYRGAARMTAAERQFERFLTAVRQFECDDSPARFQQTLARLVAAKARSVRGADRKVHTAETVGPDLQAVDTISQCSLAR